MKYLLTAAAIATLLACNTETIPPTGHQFTAKSSGECDSLQALVDSLQSDRDEACGFILSMCKHLDQANDRAANEATTLCEWANIYYSEIYLVRCYARGAMGASTQCPNEYPLTDPLFPPAWCSYEQLPECAY